jgi:hypothetical protein
VVGGVRVAHLFSFLCCYLDLVCLRPLSDMPNVCGLSILDCPSVFSFLNYCFLIRLWELCFHENYHTCAKKTHYVICRPTLSNSICNLSFRFVVRACCFFIGVVTHFYIRLYSKRQIVNNASLVSMLIKQT